MKPTDTERGTDQPVPSPPVAAPSVTAPDERDHAALLADRAFVDAVAGALEAEDHDRLRELVEPLHAADMADLIGLLPSEDRAGFVQALGVDFDPEVLTEMAEAVRDDVVEQLPAGDLAAAISQLDTDDAVYVLEDLDAGKRQEVLDGMPAEERVAVEEALAYPEDSAGRLMRRELVAVPQFWTVGQTIDLLRTREDLPDDFHEIFVVDPRYHLVGTVALNRILRSKRDALMEQILEEDQRRIPVSMDQEEVAYLFRQYNLMSAAVTDSEGRLVGVITVDDVVDVITEEADEDLLALAGVSDGDVNESAMAVTRARLPWLFINLATAFLSASVIGLFEASIQKLVALAMLMPIVASMGGNAGTQTMTVTVRALASRDLTVLNAWRVVSKEVLVNIMNGLVLAVVCGTLVGLWFGDVILGLVIATAILFNLCVAGLFGALIPLGFKRIGIDPAVASGVFLTTMTDVCGFMGFLGLAAWVIL